MVPSVLLVLSLASCGVTALVFLAALRWGKRQRTLAILLAALGGVALFWGAGSAVLEGFGLYWRAWVKGGFFLAAAVLLLSCFACAVRGLLDLPGGKRLYAIAGALAAVVLVLCMAGFGFLRVLLGGWTDRVDTRQGQKVVIEDVGIFHEIGYEYVNWFVHGERVFEWED